ncbi:MAG TPA: TIR domain-containing protein [Terriglobales bacterium]|nr:TIR domain-containing protein [Terriglobales bacterium]
MNDVETKRPAKVFLSYVSSDKASARFIADALRQSGVSTWFDEWEIHVGDSIIQRIEDGAMSSDYILLLLSPAAVESEWLKAEISMALSRELHERAIRLVPVLVADCDIPPVLRDRVLLDLRGNNREIGIRRLVEQLSAVPAIRFSELTPEIFERLVGDLLVELGFSVEASARSHDSGIDFTAIYKSHDPFGVEKKETWLVEVKLYSKSRVSISALREAVGLLADWRKAAMALIVTSGNITSEGRRFLEESEYGSRVRVIEGPELTNLIARYPALVERYFPHGGSRA